MLVTSGKVAVLAMLRLSKGADWERAEDRGRAKSSCCLPNQPARRSDSTRYRQRSDPYSCSIAVT